MKRTKRKNIKFSPAEWRAVCGRANFLKMKKSTFIRNLSLNEVWKIYDTESVCLTMRKINLIGNSINQIIRVAEQTNSEYLNEIKNLKKRFEKCREKLFRYFSRLLNTG